MAKLTPSKVTNYSYQISKARLIVRQTNRRMVATANSQNLEIWIMMTSFRKMMKKKRRCMMCPIFPKQLLILRVRNYLVRRINNNWFRPPQTWHTTVPPFKLLDRLDNLPWGMLSYTGMARPNRRRASPWQYPLKNHLTSMTEEATRRCHRRDRFCIHSKLLSCLRSSTTSNYHFINFDSSS